MINGITNIHFGKNPNACAMKIKGQETEAVIFTQNCNYETINQIKTICSHPVFKETPVRIMPDTHAGKTSVVGFTAPIDKQSIIPSLISGDIGCGMLCVNVDTKGQKIDFDELYDIIQNNFSKKRTKTPSVSDKNSAQISKRVTDLSKKKYKSSPDKILSELGTLGGGNHFIEIDKSKDGEVYLVIHSGSRRFGNEVYSHHQGVAEKQHPYKIKDLSYLSGDEAKEYLEDMKIALKYAQVNRRIIADEIIKKMGWKEKSSFESIHNYISQDGMIRKGAISAQEGERIIIPLNMRDGAIIAEGKGNKDWNCSAPHGAGRQFSRTQARNFITLDEYQKTMCDIYSKSVSAATLDESPQAYKTADEIINAISDTAKTEEIIRPIFNYKD